MVATAPIELKRHYRQLSEDQTDKLVEAVADLMVTYLKNSKVTGSSELPTGGTEQSPNDRRESLN